MIFAQADALVMQAKTCDHFNTYVKDFTRQLFLNVQSPSDLLAASEIWSKLPIPNYLPLRDLWRKTGEWEFAEQMTMDGQRLKSLDRSFSDLDWFPIEYSLGKIILDEAGEGANLPSYKELSREQAERSRISSDMMVAELEQYFDLNALQKEVEDLQRHLQP